MGEGSPVIVTCANCNADNAAGRRFCDQCGSSLASGCPGCGAQNRPEARFCGDCGTPLTAAAFASSSARASGGAPAPASAAASTSGAERRLVSILFADLVAFTDYSEGRDPELVRETLTRYFEATRTVIERHGGRVEKFIGDAVMAAWGAPRANEDDPERAVRAAMEVIAAVTSLDEGLQARVAVLTGQAAVTLDATDQGMVAGDLVNTAARLQGVAPPSSVLVGDATMRAASSAIAFEAVGEHQLKGKEAPVAAWRAVRILGDRGGRSRSEGLEPPFVGREVELRLLKDKLHQTTEERRPRLISITGPAGIGKSRLAWEFRKYVDGLVENVYWHHGRAPSYGDGVTFWALGEMVRRRAGLAEGDDDATTRSRLHASVEEFVERPEDRELVEPALLTLLGLAPQPPGGRDVLFAAWRIFFERIAARGTAVLVFEDLQWADAGQLDFIDHVMEWSRDVPLLIVTLARPELLESRPGWGTGARSFNAIGLEPLTTANLRDLLLGLVPTMPEAAVEDVAERADGIPLYAVETVRMLLADGRLVPDADGTFRPAGDLGELTIPDSLRALVGSRLDALDPADRALLQNAAILGKTFSAPALAEVADADEADVEARLRTLVKREVLEISVDPRSPERGQYGFVQSVIREVAYDTLARRDRRARHLAAARYFERTDDDELAGVLSTHYRAAYEASDPGPEADALQVQARLALRGAADRAVSLGSSDQALEYLTAALDITDQTSDRAPLLESAAHAADLSALTDRAIELGRASIAAYEEIGDVAGTGQAIVQLSQILLDAGMSEEVNAILPDAIDAIAADADLDPIRARMLSNLARAKFRIGEALESVAVVDRALGISERLGLDDVTADAILNKGSALASLRVVEPTILLRAAVDLARDVGDIEGELRAGTNLAVTIMQSDLPTALEHWRQVLATADRIGVGTISEWAASSVSWAMMELGDDWDEVIAYVDGQMPLQRTDSGKATLVGTRECIHIYRGDDESTETAERERLIPPEAGSEYRDWYLYFPGMKATLAGRFVEGFGSLREAMPNMGQNRSTGLHWMVLTGAWARDPLLSREARDENAKHLAAGAIHRAMAALANGVVDALDDRPDPARDAFVSAVEMLERSGWAWLTALARLAALYVMPDEPAFADWESVARDRFERLRSHVAIARLDEAVAQRARVRS